MKKRKIAYAIILLIGVACAGIGLSNVCVYLNGNINITWYDGIPMAFSTAVAIFLIGIALYLTGKTFFNYDKKIGG